MAAPTVAPYARAAFALGWASIDDPDIFPVGDTGRAACEAAIATAATLDGDEHLIRLLVETGKTEAARQALHRARLRLYTKHRRLVVAAATGLVAAVDKSLLTANLLLTADQHRKIRAQQATSSLTAALTAAPGVLTAWTEANDTAAHAATVRGHAEAAATPAGGGPADPKKVTAGLAAAATAIGAVSPGRQWISGQLRRQAWDLSGLDLPGADDPEQAVTGVLDTLDGVAAAAEDDMHTALTGAFADYFATGAGATLGQISWVTEEDDRVCPACDDNEANGPYPPDSLPDMPAHPTCRCWFELA